MRIDDREYKNEVAEWYFLLPIGINTLAILSLCVTGGGEGTTFGPINQEARNVYEYNG